MPAYIALLRGVNARRLPWQPYAETNRGRLFATGDTIAFSPPLIIEKQHIDQLVGTLADVLKTAA